MFMAEVYNKLICLLNILLFLMVITVEFCKQSILKGDTRLANTGCPEK